jgi:hypothetical protein
MGETCVIGEMSVCVSFVMPEKKKTRLGHLSLGRRVELTLSIEERDSVTPIVDFIFTYIC